MDQYVVYPIKLGTVKNVDWSHNVLNTRFGEKMDAAFRIRDFFCRFDDGDQMIPEIIFMDLEIKLFLAAEIVIKACFCKR